MCLQHTHTNHGLHMSRPTERANVLQMSRATLPCCSMGGATRAPKPTSELEASSSGAQQGPPSQPRPRHPVNLQSEPPSPGQAARLLHPLVAQGTRHLLPLRLGPLVSSWMWAGGEQAQRGTQQLPGGLLTRQWQASTHPICSLAPSAHASPCQPSTAPCTASHTVNSQQPHG